MLYDILTGHIFETRAYGEVVFLVLCMAAAWMTGRSIATDWKSSWDLVFAALGLGLAARFLHFALYQAAFLSFSRFVLDALMLAAAAWLGHRFTRTSQMTTQYSWLYEKVSPFSWKERSRT